MEKLNKDLSGVVEYRGYLIKLDKLCPEVMNSDYSYEIFKDGERLKCVLDCPFNEMNFRPETGYYRALSKAKDYINSHIEENKPKLKESLYELENKRESGDLEMDDICDLMISIGNKLVEEVR